MATVIQQLPTPSSTEPLRPSAGDDAVVVKSGQTARIPVLANDLSAADDPLDLRSLRITAAPMHAERVKVEGDRIVYTPMKKFTGIDKMQYIICTASGRCVQGVAIVSVAGP